MFTNLDCGNPVQILKIETKQTFLKWQDLQILIQIQIQIIYYKSVSYTWYFLNWKWYKQTKNYITHKKIIKLNLTPLNYLKYYTVKLRYNKLLGAAQMCLL